MLFFLLTARITHLHYFHLQFMFTITYIHSHFKFSFPFLILTNIYIIYIYIYLDFWKRYHSVEVSEPACREHFLDNIKIMTARSPFFLLPPLPPPPPFHFLSCGFEAVWSHKTLFWCRSGENRQIFKSHLFKKSRFNRFRFIYINWNVTVKSPTPR